MVIYVKFFLDPQNEEGPLLKKWVLMFGFQIFARFTNYASESKYVEENENSAKQVFLVNTQ